MQMYIQGVATTKGWADKETLTLFCNGCDFKCPHCNTPDLLEFSKSSLIDLRSIKKIVEASPLQHILFTGGEPCLQRSALMTLARIAKKKGMFVGVDTNGSRPETLLALCNEGLVDYVCLDMKAPFHKLQEVTRAGTFFKPVQEVMKAVQQSLSIMRKNQERIILDIKTVIVPRLLFRKEDLFAIAKEISWLSGRWVITPFSSVNTKWNGIESPGVLFMESFIEELQTKFPHVTIVLEPAQEYMITTLDHLKETQ
jgi:pyruvate formate lyase activating enzyme